MAIPFPRLRLRDPDPELMAFPWELPLEAWPVRTSSRSARCRSGRRGTSSGSSRSERGLVALKEEPAPIAEREYEVLRHLEDEAHAGSRADGRGGGARRAERDPGDPLPPEFDAVPAAPGRVAPGPGYLRDQLLDAMAGLLVELHRGGVYWGDCSLANTLFRRDGDKVQAYLVDAETSERHPSLSDGQRAYDLDVLVENVAFGFADLAALQDRDDLFDDALAAAESVRDRYRLLWEELTAEPEVGGDERFAMTQRVRRLNDLGFAVDEIQLVPGAGGGVRLKVAVTNRRFHANELERLTGRRALEGQARLLLNDLREYGAWLERAEGRQLSLVESAERWNREVLRPSLERLRAVTGRSGDTIQAYCDVLETKWLRSEAAGRDVGLRAAIDAYLDEMSRVGRSEPRRNGPLSPDLAWRFRDAGLDDALGRLRAAVRPDREVPGWATVDLDRSLAALAPRDGDRWRPSTGCPAAGTSDALLGAFARPFTGRDGAEIVLLEPSTEGRLAAALARHGEGPVALYLLADAGAPARASAAGFTLTAQGDGPFGPQHARPRRASVGPVPSSSARRLTRRTPRSGTIGDPEAMEAAMRVGFVGLGTMGGAMAANVARAGFEVQRLESDRGPCRRSRGAGRQPG